MMNQYPDKNDYQALRKHCENNSRITAGVVDDFLLAFAARHHGLEKKMNRQFEKYHHVTSVFAKSTVEFFKSQFIIHTVFRQGGLIEKFLRNPALNFIRGEERDFLLQALHVPWRFSYAKIVEEPAPDFFRMADAFSGEEYLLFSPGTTDLNNQNTILLWFNLIGFNGSCWQSYGPIGAFQSLGPEDILFFAGEKNPDLEDAPAIIADIEKDPLPYMMLISQAANPRVFHKQYEIMHMMSEYDLETLDTERLKKSFKSEFDSGVYRLTHRLYGEHPHFAQLYVDENEKIILFSSMTGFGFQHLVKDINALGYNYPDKPYLQVRPLMVFASEMILKTKIQLNEYEGLFHTDTDPKESKALEQINAFINFVMDDINAGRMPDIETAAKETGIEEDTARDLVGMLMAKRNEGPGNRTG